jgi:hypothetical protein
MSRASRFVALKVGNNVGGIAEFVLPGNVFHFSTSRRNLWTR